MPCRPKPESTLTALRRHIFEVTHHHEISWCSAQNAEGVTAPALGARIDQRILCGDQRVADLCAADHFPDAYAVMLHEIGDIHTDKLVEGKPVITRERMARKWAKRDARLQKWKNASSEL